MARQTTTNEADTEHNYDWETVIACGVALLLQSQWDGEPVRELLLRAKGSSDPEVLQQLRAYVRRTLEPMK